MLPFSNLQIPPPSNWQDFESLCCDLWRSIWKDSNTQKNGRQGQSQHGVDIYGRPNQRDSWAGVQCKGINNYSDKSLTEKEVTSEVEKAKSFEPKLSQFIIATTGAKDAKIEKFARKITDEHLKSKLFSVNIWAWNDIKERLEDFPEVKEKCYPDFSQNTKDFKKEIDDLKKITQEMLKQDSDLKTIITPLSKKIDKITKINRADLATTILTSEHQAELDYSRDLLNNYKPKEALKYLEKLKNRIWSTAQPIVKYRILTNIGSAKLSLNKEHEAAKLFIEALQYDSKDEKALCNSALGYLLLGQLEEAKNSANEVLEKNPASSRAYSIIIQTSPDEAFEDIIEKVPEPHRNSTEVAYVIGYLARKKKDLTKAKKWLQIAIENDKDKLPGLKGALGETLLELIMEDPSVVYTNQIDDVKKEKIDKAIQMLTSAWESIADTDLRKLRLSWIVNRSIAKSLLSDLEGAIRDIEIALEIEANNPMYIKYRARFAYENKDNPKAIELFKKILLNKDNPEIPLLLAWVLRDENKSKEAITIINDCLKNDLLTGVREETNRLLIQLYIDTKDFDHALKISDSMRDSEPKNILNLVDAARIARFSSRSGDAVSLLKEATKYTDDSSTFRQLLVLADEFYFLEQFEDAAKIYERITDKNLDNVLTRRLLNSYYRSGETKQALPICQSLHIKFGPLKYISEMESAIYEEIGDLEEAKKVCQEYLKLFPDDFEMKLRQAVVNFRCSDFEKLDKFLSLPIDIDALSFESGTQLAYLYANRRLEQKALEITYEMRRKYFNNSDAHLKYLGLFFGIEKDNEKWLSYAKVCIDTAVCIEDDSGQREWYIIEDREDTEIARREIKLKHPLAQKLLNKSIGDEILLQESDLSNRLGKIIGIKSKYVYALHESMSSFEKIFPKTPGFQRIKIVDSEKEGNLPKGFQKIFDQVSSQYKMQQEVERFYKDGKLTIGAFANFIKRDVLDVWGNLIRKQDLGVKCCIGNDKERNHAILLLKNKPKLIVDIISLMTLQTIKAKDIIIKAFGKLGIAQSTIDFLQCIINERQGIQSKGFMTIGKEGDKFIRQEISVKDVKDSIEYLENILNWIKNNCEIIPCKAALDIKRNKKQQLDQTMGQLFIDTILIASEPGNSLYSDDERLRSFAKSEFNVDGVWTQVLLMHCLNIKVLEKNKYNKMAIKLVNIHYYHTSIDADILVESAKQAKWVLSQPYTSVLQVLQGKSSNENSALIVATEFLYKLWVQSVLVQQRDCLTINLLDTIVVGRSRGIVLNKLISFVKKRFFLLPLAEREIISLINAWEKTHIM